MSGNPSRGMSFSSVLLLALLLLLAGGGVAIWILTRYDAAARFVGLAQPVAVAAQAPVPLVARPVPAAPAIVAQPATAALVESLEARIARVENATARAEGSAGRADALLVAFAARRAIDRGVALGYLEPLLSERFAATHPQAVATIVTSSRRPVRLDQLTADFTALAPRLKAPSPSASLWQNIRGEMGSLVSIRRADQPSQRPSPTYDRALARLNAGQVDQALAEAMRLPGIGGSPKWVADARTYIASHRALDEIESGALLSR
ncbi:hypothetical protein GCM10022280_03260 [Sphingomonas swuensis]|uniref:Uncharacterized protein n=1 Tax=Sphingomonas swuensis TaxID=977800 RepID=A0ABP7SCG0_9SPHN